MMNLTWDSREVYLGSEIDLHQDDVIVLELVVKAPFTILDLTLYLFVSQFNLRFLFLFVLILF